MITSLLIANRGEIACRIIRTARQLGIRTVAVYSDADRNAMHVEMADVAMAIGPAEAAKSYLQADKIIAAAKASGADAIHPGYGFLSENAGFAADCERQGIIFVGPPAAAIEAMGSKSAAKQIMEKAGVPLIPGYHGDDQDPALLKKAADKMGYPVLLKATAGGGGKGMRVVASADEFDTALAAAMREAGKSFGDERMLVEKYLTKPRHIEIQLFCDQHGNAVHLFERDCSVQRRHQKVIEEAPAPGMTAELRAAMGDTAIRAARAIDYVGAGTVEFLLDTDGRFYFMEMNTRLQVEHPVTEWITGQDLVEWQLRVAAGETLPRQQSQLTIQGHAFEARLYAEDPAAGFLPRTGRITTLQVPSDSDRVRIDTGVREGDEVSVYYDPMIAKLICRGKDRRSALQQLRAALNATRIAGLATNVPFLHSIASHPAFIAEDIDTGFIDRHAGQLLAQPQAASLTIQAAAALALTVHSGRQRQAGGNDGDPHSPWRTADQWRLNLPASQHFEMALDDETISVRVEYMGRRTDTANLTIGEQTLHCRFALNGQTLTATLDQQQQHFTIAFEQDTVLIFDGCLAHRACPVSAETNDPDAALAQAGFTAPMPGTVIAITARAGVAVKAGDTLLVMEAMKMEHSVTAPVDGTVSAFHCEVGELVDGGAELLAFEPAASS